MQVGREKEFRMASATGIPSNAAAARGQSEEEPLLGRRGDASQAEGEPLYHNLWIGMFIQAVNIEEGFVNQGQVPHLLRRRASGS